MGNYETDLRWTLTGLGAGALFGAWAMGVALFTSSPWAVPQGIAEAAGLAPPGTGFQPAAVLLGLAGWLAISFLLGTCFMALAAAFDIRGPGLVTAGLGFGLIVYGFLYYPILRGLMAGSSQAFLSANPEWSWALAHLVYGVALGALAAYGPGRLPRRRRTA